MILQKGFALLEMSVAAVLATLVAVLGAGAIANAMKEAGARSGAAWMLEVRQAAQAYLMRYGHAIRQEPSMPARWHGRYADWSAPTLEELKADGLMAQRLPLVAPVGGSAIVRILRHGRCPGMDCRLDAVIYSSKPLLRGRRGSVDERLVSQWLLASEGQGGWVSSRNPGHLRGSLFSMRNPDWPGEALPPGTVAMMALGVGGEQLRVGDHRDPDLRGPVTFHADVRAKGDVAVGGYLMLQGSAREGQACAGRGAVGLDSGYRLLVCDGTVWISQSAGTPIKAGILGYTVNSLRGCLTASASPDRQGGVQDCRCPQGSSAVQVAEEGPKLFAHGITRRFLCVP